MASLLLGGSSHAAGQATSRGNRVLTDVTACRKIVDTIQRLACFDRTAAALETAKAEADIVVMDRAEVKEKKRALFGLRLPEVKLFGRDDDARSDVVQIETTVTGLSRFGRDRWTVRLKDASVWQTTEPARFDPEQGDDVVIKPAALGSFRGSFKGARSVRMERIR